MESVKGAQTVLTPHKYQTIDFAALGMLRACVILSTEEVYMTLCLTITIVCARGEAFCGISHRNTYECTNSLKCSQILSTQICILMDAYKNHRYEAKFIKITVTTSQVKLKNY